MFGFDYIRVAFAFRHVVEMPNRQLAMPFGDQRRVRTGIVGIQAVFKAQDCISPSEVSVYT